jgi:polyisoprenoid-binding protein YceI
MDVTRNVLAAVSCLAMPMLLMAAPEVYTIEPAHTYPSFETAHEGMSFWRGKFNKTSGKIWLDRAGKTGKVDIEVDATSINFGMAMMDKVAQGEDFFQADKYPTATYKSDSITWKGDKPVSVNGTLTIRGISKPVPLQVTLFQCKQNPMLKREVCGGDVHGEFDRREFGMTRGVVASDPNVRLAIQVEAIQGDTLPTMGPPPGGGAFPPPGANGGPPGGAPPAGAGGPPPRQ